MMDIAVFDLYYILVEVLFGSIWLSGIAVAVTMVIVAVFMKMSPLLQIFLVGQFLFAFAVGYFGAFALVIGFIIALLTFIGALMRFIMSKGGYS